MKELCILASRSRRVIVFDMDSTLIQQEVIDELGRIANVEEAVKKVRSGLSSLPPACSGLRKARICDLMSLG